MRERTQEQVDACGPAPVIRSDDSSGILVPDGEGFLLYTMHPAVRLWRHPHEPGPTEARMPGGPEAALSRLPPATRYRAAFLSRR